MLSHLECVSSSLAPGIGFLSLVLISAAWSWEHFCAVWQRQILDISENINIWLLHKGNADLFNEVLKDVCV